MREADAAGKRSGNTVRVSRLCGSWLACLLSLASGPWVHAAAPYTPTSDDEVLERLPRGLRSADLRRERAELADDPENLRDSLSMAASYLETARVEGDPRFLGYTQSILGPWWNQASPPSDVRVMRAAVFAIGFEFDRALAELDLVQAGEPGHIGAGVARVEVCLARGDLDGAARALELAASGMSPGAVAIARARCERGGPRLDAAVESLEKALASPAGWSATERHAALVLLADLAMQRGTWDEAAARFGDLRRLGKRDVRALALESDFELGRGTPQTVVERLKGEAGHDGLAVRLLEAWMARGEGDADDMNRREELRRQVEKRLTDRRARGDVSVLPEAVRYWVRVQPDPARAVERAGELWAVRRTSDDARWVLEAARLGKDGALRKRVAEWVTGTGVQDARLSAELSRWEGRP